MAKKYLLALASIASIIMFGSCAKDSQETTDNNDKIAMTLGISLKESAATRATVANWTPTQSGQSVIWEKGDEISVFVPGHGTGDVFKFDKFGELNNVGFFNGYSYKNGPYIGLYPAQTNARIASDGALSFNIPSVQTAVQKSFDPKAGIQIGKSQNWEGALDLAHVCAYFVVKVDPGCTQVKVQAMDKDDDGVGHISIYESSNWYLAGDVIVGNISSGNYAITDFNKANCQTNITLSNGNLSSGGDFMIPFIPSTKGPCLQVTATYSDGKCEHIFYPTSGTFQFIVGEIYNLGHFSSDTSKGVNGWLKSITE